MTFKNHTIEPRIAMHRILQANRRQKTSHREAILLVSRPDTIVEGEHGDPLGGVILQPVNEHQTAIVEFWRWTTATGWHCARRILSPIPLRQVSDERRDGEVSVWKCRGLPCLGANDTGLLQAFVSREAPPGEVL